MQIDWETVIPKREMASNIVAVELFRSLDGQTIYCLEKNSEKT